MKKFVLFFGLLLVATMINAQVPQGFKYQTVARNNAGEILASQNISFRMTILQGALPGTVVYAETHTATTNASGLASLEIGRGTPVTGSFAAINWSTTPVFLKTEIDPAGGSAFIEMGTSEVLSVPFALFAKTAGNGFSGDYNDLSNKPTLWDSTWLSIKNKPTTITGYGITDGMTTAHAANGISTGNIADWNAAFGWGNHATAGYLTSFTETDPIFGVHPSSGITSGNISNWNTAFGWGNHAVAGYLTSFTETDPIFVVHPASGITSGNILNWNTVFGWGNHATAGYLTSFTETDPVFGAWDKSAGIAITENQITDLQDYLTVETDPEFNAWDKSTGIAITENQITDLKDYLTVEFDGDPVNELQTVTETNYQVTLSQGGGSFMTGVKSFSQAEIDTMTPYNGLTVINTTTNCVNYYVINNWFEACGTCTPQPTQANAGSDQIGYGGTTTTLEGNSPIIGTGLWAIISGEGGVLSDPTNPNTTFSGLDVGDYYLTWTIGTSCQSSIDTVNIRFWNCNQSFTDIRDGEIYNTVLIGTQCWMAQNLNIGTRISQNQNPANNTTIEKHCYDNADANCNVYGGLYQWSEMMNYSSVPGVQGICPSGWHLPTDEEWCTLTTYLDATVSCSITGGLSGTDIGGKMKETGITHWASPNTGANNSSGFTALPGGHRSIAYSYASITTNGYFWSSTPFSSNAWFWRLDNSNSNIFRSNSSLQNGFSVRCLKD